MFEYLFYSKTIIILLANKGITMSVQPSSFSPHIATPPKQMNQY